MTHKRKVDRSCYTPQIKVHIHENDEAGQSYESLKEKCAVVLKTPQHIT